MYLRYVAHNRVCYDNKMHMSFTSPIKMITQPQSVEFSGLFMKH